MKGKTQFETPEEAKALHDVLALAFRTHKTKTAVAAALEWTRPTLNTALARLARVGLDPLATAGVAPRVGHPTVHGQYAGWRKFRGEGRRAAQREHSAPRNPGSGKSSTANK